MSKEIVKYHYIALAKLLKNYNTAPLDRNILKASHEFCKSLYEAAKAHPDLIFAQPQLFKPQLPFVVNLAFNSAVLTCLLAVRNKFDPSVTIQLMCGSLSIYALEQSSIEKYYQSNSNKPSVKTIGSRNTKFVRLLELHQQNIWLSSYLLCSYIHLNHYPRTNLTTPVAALAYLANKFALLCTPNKHIPSISFAAAIKQLSLQCCPKWYGLMAPLLRYPSVTPPGSYVRLRDGSIQIVLSLSDKRLVTKPLPIKQSLATQSDKVKIQYSSTEDVTRSFPCQPLNSFTRLNQWWNTDLIDWLASKNEFKQTAFASISPIKTAPASLLVIQDQLCHTNTDIAVIVKAIENEPEYVHQLQFSATINNRQKQPIQNIQHCLTLLGFERTNSILMQHSLMSRLNQQYFPLQQKLLNFNQFFVFITRELAVKTEVVSPEQASTTANFIVSRLFTLSTIRTLMHWPRSTHPNYKVASLIKVKDTKNLKNDAFLLANAWHQNKPILDALQHYDLAPQYQNGKMSTLQLCYLLGLSLILAQEYYFSEQTRCKETTTYINAGLFELGLSPTELVDIMAEVIANTNVFCQLE